MRTGKRLGEDTQHTGSGFLPSLPGFAIKLTECELVTPGIIMQSFPCRSCTAPFTLSMHVTSA